MPKERRISVSITDEMYEFLNSQSAQSDRPLASVVRVMIQRWIDQNAPPVVAPEREMTQ